MAWFYIAFVFAVLTIPYQVDCLDCYSCTSSDSWKDCNSNLSKTKCPATSPNCLKGVLTCTGSGNEEKTIYYKRCGAQGETCDSTREDTPQCSSSGFGWSFSSSNTCCNGNYCNSSPSGAGGSIIKCAALVLLAFAVIFQ